VLTSIPGHLVKRTSWNRLLKEPKKCIIYFLGPLLYTWAKSKHRSPENSLKVSFENLIDLIPVTASIIPVKTWTNVVPHNAFHRQGRAKALADTFAGYGSDKGRHGYAPIYQTIVDSIQNSNQILTIVEIGLGSSNPRIPSNMGVFGSPGASLRAFRDFVSSANIIGGDIDASILFTEERIQTHYVNQLDKPSIETFLNHSRDFDLLVDDGLHDLDANLNTLCVGISRSKVGSWIVIEDIDPLLSRERLAISELIRDQFTSWVIQSNFALIFVAVRHSPAGTSRREARSLFPKFAT